MVVTGGKQAIFDALDATNGLYASSIDLGLQNLVTSIDPKTGAKTVDPRLVPGDGETKFICPHTGGARSWLPTSYDPSAKLIYIPLVESCGGPDTGCRRRTRQSHDRRALDAATAT